MQTGTGGRFDCGNHDLIDKAYGLRWFQPLTRGFSCNTNTGNTKEACDARHDQGSSHYSSAYP